MILVDPWDSLLDSHSLIYGTSLMYYLLKLQNLFGSINNQQIINNDNLTGKGDLS